MNANIVKLHFFHKIKYDLRGHSRLQIMTFSIKNSLFLLFMLLIDRRNKCRWTLWKKKVWLIQRRHLPCFNLNLRSYEQFLSSYHSRPLDLQDFVIIYWYKTIIPVNFYLKKILNAFRQIKYYFFCISLNLKTTNSIWKNDTCPKFGDLPKEIVCRKGNLIKKIILNWLIEGFFQNVNFHSKLILRLIQFKTNSKFHLIKILI